MGPWHVSVWGKSGIMRAWIWQEGNLKSNLWFTLSSMQTGPPLRIEISLLWICLFFLLRSLEMPWIESAMEKPRPRESGCASRSQVAWKGRPKERRLSFPPLQTCVACVGGPLGEIRVAASHNLAIQSLSCTAQKWYRNLIVPGKTKPLLF